ncbi:MAG: response regulator [Fibrobacteria bacterium]|nr:response regulator [Fibrobacteria bacterium]
MYNICFVISSIGGPKIIGPLFTREVPDDTVFIIYQRMPTREFMEAFLDCLREDIPRHIEFVEKDTRPVPGGVYFISNQFQYILDDDYLRVVNHENNPEESADINSLLLSVADSNYSAAVVVLSGMLEDKGWVDGIRALKANGAQVLATSRSHTPVYQMIEELQKLDLIDDLYPPTSLLANLEFTHAPQADRAKAHWLVVDDEENVREVIGDILFFENIACDFAKDGLEALSKVQKTKYSAIMLDIKMPELNGLKTIEALETIEPNIPVLIITGYDDSQTKAASHKPNVIGILLKPFTGEDIKKFFPLMQEQTGHCGS